MSLRRLQEALKIKGPDKPDDKIHQALEEIRSLGKPNPFDSSETVVGDAVGISVFLGDNVLWLKSIRSFNPRHGNATIVMNMVCDIADKYQLDISLAAVPFGNPKIKKNDLIRWYKTFGFKVERGTGDSMIRKPKADNKESDVE